MFNNYESGKQTGIKIKQTSRHLQDFQVLPEEHPHFRHHCVDFPKPRQDHCKTKWKRPREKPHQPGFYAPGQPWGGGATSSWIFVDLEGKTSNVPMVFVMFLNNISGFNHSKKTQSNQNEMKTKLQKHMGIISNSCVP